MRRSRPVPLRHVGEVFAWRSCNAHDHGVLAAGCRIADALDAPTGFWPQRQRVHAADEDVPNQPMGPSVPQQRQITANRRGKVSTHSGPRICEFDAKLGVVQPGWSTAALQDEHSSGSCLRETKSYASKSLRPLDHNHNSMPSVKPSSLCSFQQISRDVAKYGNDRWHLDKQ